MKTSSIKIFFLCLAVSFIGAEDVIARGFGGGGGGRSFGGGGGGGRSFGGGGGGRSFGGGGGGMSRPSSPSVSRPTSRPSSPSMSRPSTPSSRPSMPSSRPNIPSSRPSTPSSRPSIPSSSGSRPNLPSSRPGSGGSGRPGQLPSIQPGNRPSTLPGSRPGIQPGGRPSIQPGNRPSLPGTRPGSGGNRPGSGIDTGTRLPGRPGSDGRPSTLPGLGGGTGDRPSIGDRPGNRPGNGDRPNIEDRPGTGDRPNIGDRPGNRPGNGDRPNIGDRPNAGDRPGNRPDRPSFDDRKNNLNDRLTNIDTRDININNIGNNNNIGNRNNQWDSRHDNWNNWHDNHYHHHGDWHHGNWHGHYYPGGRWNYWWDNYPVMTAFGVTTWAVNRVGWAFGYNSYTNPYATSYVDNSSTVYDYSQPIVMTPDEQTLAGDPASTEPPAALPETALSSFDQARNQFYDGDYDAALKSTDAALKEMPNDTAIHEFRALVTFALADYQQSAATLYAVLSVGPGWDWTTLSGLYPSVDVYTEQLRALESYCKKNPSDQAARFVLAYQYVTAGHDDAAIEQLQGLVKANPQDQVSIQMLQRLDPDAEIPNPAKKVEPPKPADPVETKQLQGSWKATRGESSYEMELEENQEFTWKFTADGKTQEVRGIWSVDKDGVLAMEMNDSGVMLAQTIVKGNDLEFYMLGDTTGNDPIDFKKK